jgi:hypothetical protein
MTICLFGVLLALLIVDEAATFSVLPDRRTLPSSSSSTTTSEKPMQPLYFSRRSRDFYDYDDEFEGEEDLIVPRRDTTWEYRQPRLRKEAELTRVSRRRVTENLSDDDTLDDVEEEFLEEDEIDASYDDPPSQKRSPKSRSANRRRSEYEEMDEELWDEEDMEFGYEEDDEPNDLSSGGNFWSNPTGGMDRPLDRDLTRPRMVDVPPRGRNRPQREYDGRPDYFVNDRRRTPRRGPEWRSPVRTGTKKPPKLIEDLYNRLFFYGFDVGDNLNVGDKTVFGGTKGKFNGLKYLAAAKGRDPARYNKRRSDGPRPRSRRGLPPARDEDDLYDEEEYFYDEDEDDRPQRYSLQDSDSYPTQSVRKRYSRRMERGSAPSSRFESAGNDWISEQVSSWFTDRDNVEYDSFSSGDQYKDEPLSRSSRRRRRRSRGGSDWTPMSMIDSFFRIDREEMSYKAAEYDAKMGLRRGKSRRNGANESRRILQQELRDIPDELPRETPRRTGYAYKYDASLDDDDSPTVLDIDATIEEDSLSDKETLDAVEKGSSEETRAAKNDNARSEKGEKSWEERQAAVERVPPSDVAAWGPKGELPINARQKAIEDALKDIQTAKRKLNERIKKEIKARDEVAILNVDAKAQRLKIEQSRRGGPRYGTERLRQTELEIDEASRQLRRAKKRVDIARDELEELEDRHYALLSYYSPDQANRVIGEALDEFTAQIDPNPSASAQVESSGIEEGDTRT